MILTVGGIKGGTGKTTLVTNLVVLRSMEKKRVLLIDADEQGSSTDWVSTRLNMGLDCPWTTIQLRDRQVFTETRKLADSYDDIIIDTGGRDDISERAAACICDVYLSPFRPRSFDTWTVGALSSLMMRSSDHNKGIRCLTVINQGDPSGSDNEDAKKIIEEFQNIEHIPQVIGYRKAFSNASAMGYGIVEPKRKDEKAIQEIEFLYRYIYGH